MIFMSSRILIDRDVAISMRDGTTLRADIYRPDTGEPSPTTLNRLPYNPESTSFAFHYAKTTQR